VHLQTHAAEWEGFRNRLLPNPPRVTQQDFGFWPTNHAGGEKKGEIGGRVQRSTVPASYALAIPPCSLDEPLHASGKMAARRLARLANAEFARLPRRRQRGQILDVLRIRHALVDDRRRRLL
jgi:hypothetical protein